MARYKFSRLYEPGYKFHWLTIIKVFARSPDRAKNSKKGLIKSYLCRCTCGKLCVVAAYMIKKRKSCGCSKNLAVAERNGSYKHGHHVDGPSPTYRSWQSMLTRCEYPDSISYVNYGGRGIKVCARWHKFENFLRDMGARPKGKSLDRYPDNDGNYELSNCRWATRKQQAIGRRKRRVKSDTVTNS
jgi:hypothetical protein